MPIPVLAKRQRTFTGTKRRLYHLLEVMGTSNDQIWPFAAQPFMRSPGPLTPGRTEEWHLGVHAMLEEAVPEEHIVWRFLNEGIEGTHGFYITADGKQVTLEMRVEAALSEPEGRMLWRRLEDGYERSSEALFDKITRVLKR